MEHDQACGCGCTSCFPPPSRSSRVPRDFPSSLAVSLHYPAFFGGLDVAEALLDAGADLEAVSRNAMGARPLHSATAGRHLDYWLALARDIHQRPHVDEQFAAWVRLAGDLDNLRAAADDGYATGRSHDAVELALLMDDGSTRSRHA